MGSAERPSDNVQERGSKEEIHDHAMEEAEQNEVEELEEGTEDNNTMAAIQIRKSGDESTNSEDEDTSEEEAGLFVRPSVCFVRSFVRHIR
jgi:hypothetical protein